MAVDTVVSMVGVGLGDAVVEAVLFPEGKPCSIAATPYQGPMHGRSHGMRRIALRSSVYVLSKTTTQVWFY